jgi:hypothetical protein
MEGWIKLHRRLLNWEWFTTPNMTQLFIYLLLTATHKDGKFKGYNIKRGQTVVGLTSLNKKTGISVRSLRTCINRLKSTGEITVQATNKFSIITICNYDSYNDNKNGSDRVSDMQADNQPTGNRQATDNIQEYKEDKKVEEERNKKAEILKKIIEEDLSEREKETQAFIDDLMNDRI